VKTYLSIGLLGTLALGGCASAQPPSELIDARAAYQRASTGPAAQLSPADLHVARQTLDEAERSFKDDGPSEKTRDAAYTADRRVQIAEVHASTIAAQREKEQLVKQAAANQAIALQNTTAALGQTKEQLEAQRMALQGEQQRRMDAEKRAKEASDALAKFAVVKQEPRGMVITLSGGVLFVTNKSAPSGRAGQAAGGRQGAHAAGQGLEDRRRGPHRLAGRGRHEHGALAAARRVREELPRQPGHGRRPHHRRRCRRRPSHRRQRLARRPRQQPTRRDHRLAVVAVIQRAVVDPAVIVNCRNAL